MSNKDLLYQIALTRIPKVGSILSKNLISYCGGVEGIFRATKKDLLKIPGIGEGIATSILEKQYLVEAEKEIDFVQKHEIKTLFFTDKEYPQRLKPYNNSPILLYFKGDFSLDYQRVVSIVGTRKPTPNGEKICEELVEKMKGLDVLVVSGMAYGIDICAHKKCLELSIPTVGVLGHGLDRVYPSEHRNVAEKMLDNGGLLTEFSTISTMHPDNFPARNRIIAGLCDALIVVETAQKGGSMISAEMANEYNKDVFAVPGRVKDKYSQGCNFLIKTNKAHLIESIDDLSYIMRWDALDSKKNIQTSLFQTFSNEEQFIIDIIQQEESIGIDKLLFQSKMNSSQLASTILNLEFKGAIKSLPGKRYVLA